MISDDIFLWVNLLELIWDAVVDAVQGAML
jgi:hypothetical protein